MRLWIIISVAVIFTSIGLGQTREPNLKMIEEAWVPDSVFSPYHGIDFDFTVWKWQWRNGLTDEKPFDNWEQEEEAIKNRTYKPPEYVPPSDDYLSIESYFHSWEVITVIRAYYDDTKSSNDKIWIVEEIINPADEDTAGAFLPYSTGHNSRYRLIVLGDTVMTFKAYSSATGSHAILNARYWEGGYSFTYQEAFVSKPKLHAVFNGKDLNEDGYQRTLGCTILDGELFYIFQKNDKWGWSYNGEDHAGVWDDIYFHYGDGESGPNDDPSWKGISALRDGMWYLVRFERD